MEASNVFQWLARIICITAILFISLFSADAFEPGLSFQQQTGHFFMHLIPSFILLAILIMAWKRELIGGIILCGIAIGLCPYVFMHNYQMNHSIAISMGIILVINFPFILAGILFIVSYFKKKSKLLNQQA